MLKKYWGNFIYFFKAQFRKYKRFCLNANYPILIICALFVMLKFSYEVTRFRWLFWDPPNHAATITITGKLEKVLNNTNKIPRIKINVGNNGKNIFIDCEPQPYLNRCLDNKSFNFFDNKPYTITYLEYVSNNDYGIEKILMGISDGDKSILNKEQRIEEITSEPIIRYGSKYNYEYIRVSGDKHSKLIAYNFMAFGIIVTLFLIVIPLFVKISWDIKNNHKKIN